MRLWALITVILMTVGCSFEKDYPDPSTISVSSAPYVHELSISDTLNITVFNEPEISGTYNIAADKTLNFPMIGEVDVKGFTVKDLERQLEHKLAQGFINSPQVSITISNYNPVYILGEVNAPGSYPYAPDLNIVKAVALAGGYTHRARKDVYEILRGGMAGETPTYAKDVTPVYPGDIITVKERFF